MNKLTDNIQVAMKEKQAELVLKNASVINVHTQSIDHADIAINGDTIVGIGEYQGIKEIDCSGMYVAPGFIDSHVHIESSMVTPEVFSHLVIKRGITTIIADPHEIANVMGNSGIELMLKSSEKAVIDNFFMLPSCVPAVSFEDNGAILNAKKLAKLIKHPKILGLGEVMDVSAVTSAKEDMLSKIKLAKTFGKHIDGHCPKVNNQALNAYLTTGINTDHECTDEKEALEKVKLGMYVMIREGSQTRDLEKLIGAVNENNYQRFLFCTDDRHIEDLIEEGSIDHCIRLSIAHGLDPIKAYTIASLNASICFGLKDRGSISPGKKADLVIFNDLEKLNIEHVIKNGKFYHEKVTFSKIKARKTINLAEINEKVFHVSGNTEYINVIKAYPKTLNTGRNIRKVKKENNVVSKVYSNEIVNKISVIERHKNTGKYFTGYIEGLGLRNAAIAQSIAHDSHNVIVVGDSDSDMKIAVNHLIKIDGGIVFVSGGNVLESISLPIGGIMTYMNPEHVLEKVKNLNHLARTHGIKADIDPFITLSFMALPVIPEIKITARGLFDCTSFKFIELFTDKIDEGGEVMEIQDILQPNTLSEAKQFLMEYENSTILAGGTDLILDIKRGNKRSEYLIDLSKCLELKTITETDNAVSIGSMVTFSDLIDNPIIKKHFKALYECAKSMGSPQIRNIATIGGNIINAQAASDSIPCVISLEGKLVFESIEGKRTISCEEYFSDFITNKVKNNEVLTQILLPKKHYQNGFYKLGKRNALAIARLSASVNLKVKDNMIEDIIICLGAVGRYPFRVKKLEQLAIGKHPDYLKSDESLNLLEEAVYESIKTRQTMPFKKEAVKGVFMEALNNALIEVIL